MLRAKLHGCSILSEWKGWGIGPVRPSAFPTVCCAKNRAPTLKPDDDSEIYDRLGGSVAVSGDWAVTGAMGEDSAASDGGAVYVFKRDGSDWRIYQKLTASD